MADRWRELIERFLPWYEPAVEKRRDRRTEAIRLRSIAWRKRSERLIDEYRSAAEGHATAAEGHNVAGERLVDEMRRADDER